MGTTARRQQAIGALLDLLVRKKIITDQEAEELRRRIEQGYANTSAGKLKMSTPLTEMEIYGDIRVRYEYRAGDGRQYSGRATCDRYCRRNDWQERKRERYRLRLGCAARWWTMVLRPPPRNQLQSALDQRHFWR